MSRPSRRSGPWIRLPTRRSTRDALNNIIKAWPAFETATVEESWAGMMDITPDNNPVLGPIAKLPGLTLATGLLRSRLWNRPGGRAIGCRPCDRCRPDC
ncbi:FAD-dependent oxidoreductase [uncultured Cohaesibacter sp.]|uniref:FAD-dependent oxidoreductase n=1 Tax=uncultured Cohaesibacter sp. TaxID=1002546 RepID=UPI002D1E3B83|nr:FAD-dependent oxidoreductase [uncultured Cohaesibacter sp.]